MSASDTSLPSLLYIGDVPVEASYHGSALLYRLLQNYPTNKLLIVEGNLVISQIERRLPKTNYKQIYIGNQRLLNTRFHSWFSSWFSLIAAHRARNLERMIADFQPEAILTVAHSYSWLTAAEYARLNNLPLHLIIHDDWPSLARLPRSLNKWLNHKFARIYQQAASRLCVSPFMEEEYQMRYGVSGSVLYPSRAQEVPLPSTPVLTKKKERPLTVVFGGTINTPGYIKALKDLAQCLQKFKGQLLIYGPLTQEQAISYGLQESNISLGGLLSPDRFLSCIQEEADILFVPMSFDSTDKHNMQISFPSKLTDYTSVGLPLLIYGPDYCSAVRWAQENPGVAEIVTHESSQELVAAFDRLSSQEHRIALAKVALSKGSDFFSHTQVQTKFFSHLINV